MDCLDWLDVGLATDDGLVGTGVCEGVGAVVTELELEVVVADPLTVMGEGGTIEVGVSGMLMGGGLGRALESCNGAPVIGVIAGTGALMGLCSGVSLCTTG